MILISSETHRIFFNKPGWNLPMTRSFGVRYSPRTLGKYARYSTKVHLDNTTFSLINASSYIGRCIIRLDNSSYILAVWMSEYVCILMYLCRFIYGTQSYVQGHAKHLMLNKSASVVSLHPRRIHTEVPCPFWYFSWSGLSVKCGRSSVKPISY